MIIIKELKIILIMYPGQNKYKRYKMNLKKKIKMSKIIKKEFEILKN